MTNAKIIELELSPAEHLKLLEALSRASETKLAVKVNQAWLESEQIVVEPPNKWSKHLPVTDARDTKPYPTREMVQTWKDGLINLTLDDKGGE